MKTVLQSMGVVFILYGLREPALLRDLVMLGVLLDLLVFGVRRETPSKNRQDFVRGDKITRESSSLSLSILK